MRDGQLDLTRTFAKSLPRDLRRKLNQVINDTSEALLNAKFEDRAQFIHVAQCAFESLAAGVVELERIHGAVQSGPTVKVPPCLASN